MHVFISVTNIMSYNSINLILTPNKLIEPKYVNWKRNMDIVLILEELRRVIQEFAPFSPIEHST